MICKLMFLMVGDAFVFRKRNERKTNTTEYIERDTF